MNAENYIPQTMSAKSGVKCKNITQVRLKEAKVLNLQAYVYSLELAENEISQQSADQLPAYQINPIEFDGVTIKAELWNPKKEQEEKL